MVELADRYVLTSNRESGFGRYDVMHAGTDRRAARDHRLLSGAQDHTCADHYSLLQILHRSGVTGIPAGIQVPADRIRRYGFAFCGKKVLRDVLYRYVPREMMEWPKKGFSIPVEKWLRESELRQWAEALIDRKRLKEQGYLNIILP